MKDKITNEYGRIAISPDVISTYAGAVAVECTGIVGFGALSMADGIVKLLKKEKITRGINVSVDGDKITLDFHLIIAYGVNINAVVDNLSSTVKYRLEAFTGLELSRINVYIDGVRVID